MIFVNFKTYQRASGENAPSLAQTIADVASSSGIKIIPVVSALDIKEIVQTTTLEVWAQKLDPVEFGAHTGALLAESAKEDGACGAFINHSEARLSNDAEIAFLVNKLRSLQMKSLVFAPDLDNLQKYLDYKPDFIAYEPPELIGNKETSVATSQPEVVSKAVELAKKASLPLIVGAGIHSMADVKKSLELGAVGVAVASDIADSADPKAQLLDLVEGFK